MGIAQNTKWADSKIEVNQDLAKKVAAERIRIEHETKDYELVAEKRIPLIDVLRASPLE